MKVGLKIMFTLPVLFCYGMEEKDDKISTKLNNKIKAEGNNKSTNVISSLCNSTKPLNINNLLSNLSIIVDMVDNNNTIKIRFILKNDLDMGVLKTLSPNDFTIYINDKDGNPIEKVLTNWNGEIISNGDTLAEIKKSFLSNCEASDPFSISMKVVDINRVDKIKININYNNNDGNTNFIVTDDKGNDVLDIKSLLSCLSKDKEELLNLFTDSLYCTSVKNNRDGMKIVFPQEKKLLNVNIKNYLSIAIEDENGNDIKEPILYNWANGEAIENKMKLNKIKSGFFTLFKNDKFGESSDPYSFSLRFDNKKYKKLKIAITYLDKKFYVKNNNSDVIDLDNLSNVKDSVSNIDDVNVSKYKTSDEEYFQLVKKMLDENVICTNVNGFKNSIKFIFKATDKIMLGDDRRKKLIIRIYDKDDKEIRDKVILKTWVKGENISSGSSIVSIKKLFFVDSKAYTNNKPFEFSVRFNLLEEYNKVKIEISYDNKISTFVQFKGSEIIDLAELGK